MQTSKTSFSVNIRSAVDAENPLNILLVGLEPITAKVIQGLLTVARMPFETVSDELVALETLQSGVPVDLIITETDFTDKVGADFIRRLRALDGIHQPPLIALTEHYQPGMSAHLPKPVMPPIFYSTLRDWLPSKGIDWPAHIVFAARPAPVKDVATLELVEALGAIEGLNPEVCQDLFEGDWQAFVKLIKRYLDGHVEDSTKIAQALEQADWQTAIRIAHTAKGAAGTVGLYKIQQLALELEMLLRQHDETEKLSLAMTGFAGLIKATKQQFDQFT